MELKRYPIHNNKMQLIKSAYPLSLLCDFLQEAAQNKRLNCRLTFTFNNNRIYG
jgi:hypothetical protein